MHHNRQVNQVVLIVHGTILVWPPVDWLAGRRHCLTRRWQIEDLSLCPIWAIPRHVFRFELSGGTNEGYLFPSAFSALAINSRCARTWPRAKATITGTFPLWRYINFDVAISTFILAPFLLLQQMIGCDMEDEKAKYAAAHLESAAQDNTPVGHETQTPEDAALNRKINLKMDIAMLPLLSILYLFNGLDRSNVGNAETQGFTSDIGAQPEDLNTAVSLFFVTFVTLQPLSAAVGRWVGARNWIPILMVGRLHP